MFQCGVEIAFFVIEKAFAVSDEILKIPELWPVNSRIIDFGDDSVPIVNQTPLEAA
jgi:hypothetical protein